MDLAKSLKFNNIGYWFLILHKNNFEKARDHVLLTQINIE